MWTLSNQRLICPPEFQTRLTEAGGLNRNDEPNFKFVWGLTETFRAGGCWAGDNDAPPFTGYRDLLISGEECWLLLQWYPPEMLGIPELFYLQNYDEATGLQTLGEFPYKGRYEIVNTLVHREMINNELVISRMPLSALFIDLVIPVIMSAKDVSLAKRKAVYQADKEHEDEMQVEAIRNSLSRGRAAFGKQTVSYAGQIAKNNDLQKKSDALRNNWNHAIDNAWLASRIGQGVVQK